MLRNVLVIGLGFGLVACSSAGDPGSGSLGELGEGVFTYTCIADGDAVCNLTESVDTAEVDFELGLNGEIPTALAVGARFELVFWGDVSTDDGELLFIETVPASPEHVRVGGGFVIEAPGTFAFLARSPQGFVADFTHLTAFAPSALDLWHDEQRVSSMDVVTGREINLAVVPRDEAGVALAGALPYVWSSSDDAILRIGEVGTIGTPETGTEQNDDEIRVVALAAGSAQITVTHGDISQVVDIVVADEMGGTP